MRLVFSSDEIDQESEVHKIGSAHSGREIDSLVKFHHSKQKSVSFLNDTLGTGHVHDILVQ